MTDSEKGSGMPARWVFVSCQGSPREMGRQYGEQARDPIRRNVEDFKLRIDSAGAAALRNVLESAAPEILDEIEGMSETSGVPVDVLIRLNHLPLQPEARCTPMAIAGGVDGPLVAKNNDSPLHEHFAYVVRRCAPADGLPTLQVTYAGWLNGFDAMNGAGVGCAHASAGSVFDKPGPRLDIRLRACQLLRTCRTTAEFIEGLSAGPPLTGKGINVALVDGHGATAVVEAAVPQAHVRDAGRPFVYATNHYLSEPLRQADGRTAEGKRVSVYRLGYLDWRAQTAPPASVEDLRTILSSHEPWAPCRHGGPHVSRTEWSMIAIPRESRILVAQGPPCSTEYASYEMA